MNQLFIVGVATALAASIGVSDAEAAVITRTVDTTQNSTGPLLFEFDEILDVSELTSISNGSVSTQEGGSFTIAVRTVDTSIFTQILLQNFSSNNSGQSFNQLSPITFASISIDALRFTTDDNNGGFASSTYLPSNTVFTFQGLEPQPTSSIPVPGNAWLMLLGLAGIGASRYSFKARLF
jgi:hypothetical protein